MTCHQTSDCRASQSSRLANGDNCWHATCRATRPATVVFTDHSIRRRPSPPSGTLPAEADLVPFGGGTANARDSGLAHAMAGLREQPPHTSIAFRLLQETVAHGGGDAPALAYLAEFYRNRKDDAHALPLYEEARPTQSAVAIVSWPILRSSSIPVENDPSIHLSEAAQAGAFQGHYR